jgi:LysM repeat protein
MLPFILINVIVSAVVVSAVLFIWDQRQPEPVAQAPPMPTPTVGSIAAPAESDSALVPTAQAVEDEAPEESGPPVYTVQAGDSLGLIAEQFGVSMTDIMAANGLDNPNLLSVGQQLVIPLGLEEEPTPAVTDAAATLAPLPTITPAFIQGEAIVEITEVTAAGALTEESVLVTNAGSQSINLEGWTVADQSGFVYTFGQITLFGDGAGLRLHTEAGRDSLVDLYWGLEQAIWETGETVILRDAEGTQRSEYVISSP